MIAVLPPELELLSVQELAYLVRRVVGVYLLDEGRSIWRFSIAVRGDIERIVDASANLLRGVAHHHTVRDIWYKGREHVIFRLVEDDDILHTTTSRSPKLARVPGRSTLYQAL